MASGQQQQTPYIGSKISLISKSEIRYEGILYTVDTNESTIALAKVKSYGTEGRKTDHPVEGRDEIYEYIIFKASDIKDLMVSETPKPAPMFGTSLPYDPAIVSVSSQQPKGAGAAVQSPTNKGAAASGSSTRSVTPHQQLAGGGRGGVSPTADSAVQTGGAAALGAARGYSQNRNAAFRGAAGGGPGGGFALDSQMRRDGPFGQPQQQPYFAPPADNRPATYSNAVLAGAPQQLAGGGAGRGGFGPVPPAPAGVFRNGGGGGGFRDYDDRRPPGGGGFRGGNRGGFGGGGFRGAPPAPHGGGGWRGGGRGGFDNAGGPGLQPQQHMGPRGGFGGGRGGMGGGGGGRTIGRGGREPTTLLKFDGDYDWEKANLSFQEQELRDGVSKIKIEGADKNSEGAEDVDVVVEGEGGGGRKDGDSGNETQADDQKSDEEFYDKTRSFFDRISCEALEREHGENNRPNWKRERETNAETFGQTAVRNLNYRRGGGGFRGGYGGGFGPSRGFNRGGYQNRGGVGGGVRGGYNNTRRAFY